MCLTCSKAALKNLLKQEKKHKTTFAQYSICCLDHGDHVHIRFNRADQSSVHTWHTIRCPHDQLSQLLPSNTLIHVHTEENKTSTPATEEVMNQLEKQKVKCTGSTNDEAEENMCCICHEGMKKGDSILSLSCDHVFHHACVKEWLVVADTCPTCRLQINENTVQKPKRRTRREPASTSSAALRSIIIAPNAATSRVARNLRKWRFLAKVIGTLMCVLKRVRLEHSQKLLQDKLSSANSRMMTGAYNLPGSRGDGSRPKAPSQCCIIA